MSSPSTHEIPTDAQTSDAARRRGRVLVTGATSGIGRAAARRFAQLGWEVFATGRSEAGRRALAAELTEGVVHVLALDVDAPASIASCRAEVLALTDGHGVDVIVNNAGFARVSPIAELTDVDLRSHFETNVFGLVAVTRAFLPGMMERGAGRIINVSSSGGRMSLPFVGAYHAAKFAVEALSDAMRWELASFGVRVSIIEPGPVRTAFVDHVIESAHAVSSASRYAPALGDFARLQRLAERSMIAPEVVVRDIVHAASARHPRPRYMAPRLLALVIALANLLPTWILDRVIARMFGLDRLRRRPRSPALA